MFPSPYPHPRPSSANWPSFASVQHLEDAFRSFVGHAEHVLGCARSTKMWYRNGFDDFRRFLGATPRAWPLQITPTLLDEWIGWNRGRGLGRVSLKTYWCALKAFIRAAAANAGCENPFPFAHAPKLPQHAYKALPPADCERIIASARNDPSATAFERARNTAMLAMALYAGLRKREILRLEYRDVDLDEGTIHILRGKGRNGGKDRTAYIPSELRQLLAAYCRERNIRNITAPEFFVGARTRRGVSPMVLRRLVARAREASGVVFSLHVLRHSFVTMLLRKGVPIHVARDLAGHASIQTTEGYARVFRDDLRKYVQVVRFDDDRAEGPI